METAAPCKWDDKIKCPFCGNIWLVSGLTKKGGDKLREPGNISIETFYLHCCNDVYACVFVRGNSLELVNGTIVMND